MKSANIEPPTCSPYQYPHQFVGTTQTGSFFDPTKTLIFTIPPETQKMD
ncbi:hypothetical protein BGP_1917 [Beggiatoa sp. PS]|nr:hypothetical protein BGP_1917 [Beggiatoa sp. PS]